MDLIEQLNFVEQQVRQAACMHPANCIVTEQDNNGSTVAQCALCLRDVTYMLPMQEDDNEDC